MHYWYPYANSFILPEENDQVKEVKNLEVARISSRVSPGERE